MPNGRPGDHPYTDIVMHDLEIHTEEIREIVYEVDEYGDPGLKRRARSVLPSALRGATQEEVARAERELQSLREEYRRADQYAGDSPLAACLEDDPSVYDAPLRERVRDLHEAIQAEVDHTERGVRVLSGLLWEEGWEPDSLDALRERLAEFRDDHWIWDK